MSKNLSLIQQLYSGKNLVVSLLFLTFALASARFVVRPFQGDEITGNNVLAIWQFQPGAELSDGKGEAHLQLRGRSQVVPDPVFGGALDCYEYRDGHDHPHGARTEVDTTPLVDGPFSLEAWVKLKEKPENPQWSTGYLFDKLYIPRTSDNARMNKDYALTVRNYPDQGKVRMQAYIGLGQEVIHFSSALFAMPPETWRLMAFYYDGAGTGRFYLDGELIGLSRHEGKGASAAGRLPIVLGERYGRNHSGLPGYIAQARIVRGLPSQVSKVTLEVKHPFQRTAFARMEEKQVVNVQMTNVSGQNITSLVLTAHDGLSSYEQRVADLAAAEELVTLQLPLPCDRKAGEYVYQVTLRGQDANGEAVVSEANFTYNLCHRQPEFMPVVMWGNASIAQMEATGFTHSLIWLDHLDSPVWQQSKAFDFHTRYDDTRRDLNKRMAAGMHVMGKLSPGGYFKSLESYQAGREESLGVDRKGVSTGKVDMSLPAIQQFAFNAARTAANNISMYPMVDMVLFDSEFRDSTELSFRPESLESFRRVTGLTLVPPEIVAKTGVKYARLSDFPSNRVIPDDHPILLYYRWFWAGGDGYPTFLTEAWKGLTYEGTANWKMLWDPVVRCPSKWGSGGMSDLIGHWTYVYPDPLVMSFAADEVLAMLKGGPEHQEATKMTQIIWYRSGTTGPMPDDVSKRTEWEQRLPEAKFITIPPDMLEIAFWQKISRSVKAILYHGAGSLWDKGKAGGYDFTHPGTQPRLSSLTHNVVKPFGPMLLKVPERRSKLALLESFTAQMFQGPITYGNLTNPIGRMYAALVRAHLQPEIIYDETIVRDGLEQFSVLVMPACAVLSAPVAERILAWQAAGGIVVGDERLVPAIAPDVLMPQLQKNDKEEIVACSQLLRQELGAWAQPLAEADTADAILRMRSYGSSDYLFAFNDRRIFGDYVGQYRKVMEQGVPMQTRLQINRSNGTVYDLLAGQVVATAKVDGGMTFKADFGPGEGKMYLITERPLQAVTLKVPPQMRRGESKKLEIQVLDDSGQPVNAVVPLQLTGKDPAGEPVEINGWYAAEAGKLTVTLDVAPNDTPGTWQLQARELASGLEAQATWQVQ